MKAIALVFLLIISQIMFSACNREKNNVAEKDDSIAESVVENNIEITNEQFQKSSMLLGTVQEIKFYETLKSNGYISVKPNNKASVSTPLGGLISQFYVNIGDKVKKGDSLFTFSNMEIFQIQQDFLEAKAQLEFLFDNYKRQEVLRNEKVESEKSFLQAKSEYFIIDGKYKSLKKKLMLLHINPQKVENGEIFDYGKVIAPISGYIANIKFTLGDFISPGDDVIHIINSDELYLILNVFERDILKINTNQKIEFNLPGVVDFIFEGKVLTIGKQLSDENGSVPVYCQISSQNKTRLIPGMYVEANILLNDTSKKALPESAIIEVDQKHYILVLDNFSNQTYHFKKVPIAMGNTYKNWCEIQDTILSKDQQILMHGAFNIVY